MTACADVNGGRPRRVAKMRCMIGRVAKMRRVIGWRFGQHMRPLDQTGRSPRPERSRCGAHCRRSRRNSPKARIASRRMRAFEDCAVRLLWLGGGGGGRATCDGFVVRLCDRLVCLGLPARRRANKSITGGGKAARCPQRNACACSTSLFTMHHATEQHTTGDNNMRGHDRRLKLGRSTAPRRMPLPFRRKQRSHLL